MKQLATSLMELLKSTIHYQNGGPLCSTQPSSWSVFYFAAYPGLGSWQGLFGWTSSNQGSEVVSRVKSCGRSEAKLLAYRHNLTANIWLQTKLLIKSLQNIPAVQLKSWLKDSDALQVGQRLFLQNCSQCHGSDARGQKGFPNLSDNDWLYGGTVDKLKETIIHGRKAAMPAWGEALGEQGVKEMTAYVLSLSGRKVNDKDAAAGQMKFAMCAACHGMDGKGSLAHNLPFGAPNLTDKVWLYGGSSETVAQTLTAGRNGVMPAFGERLGEDKIHVIVAYVYSLSQNEKAE